MRGAEGGSRQGEYWEQNGAEGPLGGTGSIGSRTGHLEQGGIWSRGSTGSRREQNLPELVDSVPLAELVVFELMPPLQILHQREQGEQGEQEGA